MGNTSIEWTEFTWNFLRGCSLATMPGPNGKPVLREGCRHCYARDTGGRFCGPGLPYEGLVIIQGASAHWTGKVDFSEDHLLDPLRKKKPTMIFVNSMSDLFHPNAKREWVDLGFSVMLLCPQHTFQSLTKRPDIQRDYINSVETPKRIAEAMRQLVRGNKVSASVFNNGLNIARMLDEGGQLHSYGIGEHIHLGCSIEDQPSADWTLPYMRETNWGMKWLSDEPMLAEHTIDLRGISWVVVGGESGPKARPMNVEAMRSIVDQCQVAKVSVFVKQMGAHVVTSGITGPNQHWPRSTGMLDTGKGYFRKHLVDKKGGDMSEWPQDLRIREYPEDKCQP